MKKSLFTLLIASLFFTGSLMAQTASHDAVTKKESQKADKKKSNDDTKSDKASKQEKKKNAKPEVTNGPGANQSNNSPNSGTDGLGSGK